LLQQQVYLLNADVPRNMNTTRNHQSNTNKSAADPCHRLACDIQTCLQQNNYQERRCQVQIDAYNTCVRSDPKPQNSSN